MANFVKGSEALAKAEDGFTNGKVMLGEDIVGEGAHVAEGDGRGGGGGIGKADRAVEEGSYGFGGGDISEANIKCVELWEGVNKRDYM